MPRILSIDGGGIRGIIPAIVLADLEQRTGRPICESFDLIAGTSTGGIIALALTRPDAAGGAAWSADDVVGFYSRLGPALFTRSPLHRVRTLDSLAGPRFDAAPLERALLEYFGDTPISHALRDVLVTSYDIERREPFFFKSHYARERPDRDFLMRDVARATSAGPTYFPPARLTTSDHIGYRALVDGGVFANNPAMCAWVEALNLFDAAAIQPLGASADRIEVFVAPVPDGRLSVSTTPAPRTAGATMPASPAAGAGTTRPAGVPGTGARSAGEPGTGARSAASDSARAGYPFRPRVTTWDAEWLVVSLGTGHNDREVPYRQARGWGLASWARSIIDIVFDGVADTVDYQMSQLLPHVPGRPARYYRLQTDLDEATPALGDARPENIRRLKQTAYDLVRDRSAALADIASRLA